METMHIAAHRRSSSAHAANCVAMGSLFNSWRGSLFNSWCLHCCCARLAPWLSWLPQLDQQLHHQNQFHKCIPYTEHAVSPRLSCRCLLSCYLWLSSIEQCYYTESNGMLAGADALLQRSSIVSTECQQHVCSLLSACLQLVW